MPDEKEILKAGIEGAVAGVTEGLGFRDLVQQFLGPLATEMGTGLGYVGTVIRIKLGLRMMHRANQMLTEAGIQPSVVTPKLFLPLLENASLEEDERLQECWAALLANAARPDIHIKLTPSYIEILKQLSPQEVGLLQSLSSHVLERFPFIVFNDSPDQKHRSRLHNPEETEISGSLLVELWSNQTGVLEMQRVQDLARTRPIDQASCDLALDVSNFILEIRAANQNLIRLGLMARHQREAPIQDPSHEEDATDDNRYCLTSLGLAFVTACRRPTGESRPKLTFY